ncbi:hypothetical protein XFF6990_200097 [Xanthomonas citri pv. fuscans]|nr:hypothetical protein XFF6990_200097 [Xanthomonas citri pv. fuscans]
MHPCLRHEQQWRAIQRPQRSLQEAANGVVLSSTRAQQLDADVCQLVQVEERMLVRHLLQLVQHRSNRSGRGFFHDLFVPGLIGCHHFL